MSTIRKIFVGMAWIVAARWLIRSIGLISTVILARLLIPADFGVVAMAMIVVGLIEVFSESGLVLFLIRHPDPQRSHFDTVWTLRLLVGIGLAITLLALAPAGAVFFAEPKVTPTIQALALRPLLAGLENPGIVLFRKNMTFSKDFEFLVINKVVSFVVTIGGAILLGNHWALVIGILAGGITSILQSYQMHPYRPWFDLSETRMVWGYSFWILAQSLLRFLNQRVDELIVGRFKSAAVMGYYSVAADVAAAPLYEISTPLSRVLFSGVVQIAEQRAELQATLSRILSALAVVVLSISVGISIVAADFVQVLLGAHWIEAIPLVQILAIGTGLQVLSQPVTVILNSLGNPQKAVRLTLLHLMLRTAALLAAAIWFGIIEIALARALISAVMLILAFSIYARTLEIPLRQVWASLVRPLLACGVMTGIVFAVGAVAPTIPLIRLILTVATGAVGFTAALFGLWHLAGRPAGIEADAWRLTGTWVATFRQRTQPDALSGEQR